LKVTPLNPEKTEFLQPEFVLDGLFLYYMQKSRSILMKIRHIVIAATTALLLTTGNAWASNDYRPHPVKPHHVKHHKGGGHHKAPEIDAASGTSALALLTGVLLLAGERIRSRRA
jgi:hypothetical protein